MPASPRLVGEGVPVEFAGFVRQHSASLFATALLLTGSGADAEDLVQSVLLALYPKWTRVAAADVPLAYVRRSLVNRFVSQRRLKSVISTTVMANESLPATAVPDPALLLADREALRGLLSLLPTKQRAAIVLRYYEDWDEPTIARAIGVRPGTVRTLVSRGLRTMRAAAEAAARTEQKVDS